MTTTVLATAISLLCAWSQPHCQALSQVSVNIGESSFQNGDGTMIAYGYTRWVGTRPTIVVINQQLYHPVAIAAVLAHEATEIQEGLPKTGKDCDGYEGWSGEDGFLTWFSSTFGTPSAPGNSMDNSVLQSVGQHPGRPC